MKTDLIVLIESVDESNSDRKKYLDSVKKKDRELSKEFMEFLREYCGIPFKIEVKDSMYTVKRVNVKK